MLSVVPSWEWGGDGEGRVAYFKISIPFIITPKAIKYRGLNLTKEVKELYMKTVQH